MSVTISIPTSIDHDALIAEVPSYWTEITAEQASAFAAIVENDPLPVFVSNDGMYDTYVETFALGDLSDESLDKVRELFAGHEALALVEQILAHRIKIYVTEALGLGHGRYMLSRVGEPADSVSMNLAGANFSFVWDALNLDSGEDENCGEANLDVVEKALDERGYLLGNPSYVDRLRQVVAYGRQVGASQLHWA